MQPCKGERSVLVCLNELHQHTHTNLAPDPAVGLEPRADKDGPATPLTTTRWEAVSGVGCPLLSQGARKRTRLRLPATIEWRSVGKRVQEGAARVVD